MSRKACWKRKHDVFSDENAGGGNHGGKMSSNTREGAKFASQTPAVETIIFLEYIKMFS